MAKPFVLVSAVALFDVDNRLLITQRPEGKMFTGLWEFPGGKVEENECPETALIREIREELGLITEGACLAPVGFSSHAYPELRVLLLLYACHQWEGTLSPNEGQAYRWVELMRLQTFPMPPADLPLIAMLQDAFG